MSLTHPLGLLAWLAIPLIWWLLRRADRPRERVVPSLLPFGDVQGDAEAQRRLPDPAWWAAFAAIALLGLVLAGPRTAEDPGRTAVYVDRDPWLDARAADGRTLRDHAVDRVDRLMPGALRTAPLERAAVAVPVPDVADWLAARAARAEERPVVVITTSSGPWPAGVVAVPPDVPPAGNLALVTAWRTDDGGTAVALRSSFAREVDVRVRCGDAVVDVRAVPSATTTVRLRSVADGVALLDPADGGLWDDALASDDALVVDGGRLPKTVRVEGAQEGSRWTAVLAALGYRAAPDGAVAVRIGPPGRAADGPVLHLTPTANGGPVRLRRGPRVPLEVPGETVTGGEAADALPAPRTRLAAAGRLRGGRAVWSDAHGALAAVGEDGAGWAAVALDPDAASSTWHRDPSFPVLVASLLDRLRGAPDAPPRPSPGPTADGPSDDALRAELARWTGARATRTARNRDLAAPLAAVAALLVLAAAAVAGLASRAGRTRPGAGDFRSSGGRAAAP